MDPIPQTPVNPYQAPLAETPYVPAQHSHKPTLLRSLGKWTLICGISAGPSYFWGLVIHREIGWTPALAMLAGIAVFVLAYTAIENLPEVQRQIDSLRLRGVLRFGYTVRVATSLIFPIGLFVDLYVGMIAVGIVNRVFPTAVSVPIPLSESSFFRVFVTTLLQGVLLNALLFILMALVFGIILLYRRRARPSQEELI